jgi:hypothetical protein
MRCLTLAVVDHPPALHRLGDESLGVGVAGTGHQASIMAPTYVACANNHVVSFNEQWTSGWESMPREGAA